MEPIVISIKGGQPPRKSNSRRIVTSRTTGKPLMIKSRKALDWLEAAAWQIPAEAKRKVGGPDQPLRISCFVRYESRRPDLSTELIMDMLQQNDVIADDRYVFEKVEWKVIDGKDPGVDILIEATEERNLTREQAQVIINDIAQVRHSLIGLGGPYEDGSILTHWSDGEHFIILEDGETTGYEYDHEGLQDQSKTPRNLGEANSSAKLTSEDVQQIRKLYDTGEYAVSALADMFGVPTSTVRKVGTRETWRRVPEEDD